MELHTIAIVDIRDPFKKDSRGNVIVDEFGSPILETTVIHDISRKKEASINSLSRQEIANKNRQAEIVEAETREQAETRKLQADEIIGRREQEKKQNIAIDAQKAAERQMAVERTNTVLKAEIDADAAVKRADGEKRATIEIANGNKEKAILEGDGEAKRVKFVGEAEAAVILAKKTSEAEGLSKMAEAQKKQQETAKDIREIERLEVVGLAMAKALESANINYYGSGDPKNFMDFFTPRGGISLGGGLGTFLNTLKASDPNTYEKIQSIITSAGKKTQRRCRDIQPTCTP